MRLRKIAFVLLALFSFPAACSAGPIEFQLTPRGFWTEPEPMLTAGLYSTFGAGAFTVDPATGLAAMTGPLVNFDASRLPQPRPIDLQSGYAFWNNSGNFSVEYRLTDVESGEYADLVMWGRAHAGAYYANGQWTGGVTYWFGHEVEYATLGGKDYVVWGQQRFTGEQPALSVWVGEHPPFPWAPEPGTFALAALGFVPFALRGLRRMW